MFKRCALSMALVFLATPALADGGVFGPSEPTAPAMSVHPVDAPIAPARPSATQQAASPDRSPLPPTAADKPFGCVSGGARCDGHVAPSRSNLMTRERIFEHYR